MMPGPQHDLQFEAELKRFRPRTAPPLPPTVQKSPRVRWELLAAAMLLIAFGTALILHSRRQNRIIADHEFHSVTLGHAEAALAHASSFEDAVDKLERESRSAERSKPKEHTQSAFAVLSRETP